MELTWDALAPLTELAKGSFGQVFRSKDGKYVVKVFMPFDASTTRARVVDEYLSEVDVFEQLAAYRERTYHLLHMLNHVNTQSMQYIVFHCFSPFVRRDGEPYTENELRSYVPQLLWAVRQLHTLNLVHRDIKPENILLQKRASEFDTVLVLGDMGGVANIGEVAACPTSYAYAAPELAAGEVAYTAACDWFSVGAVLWYMIRGADEYISPRIRDVLFALDAERKFYAAQLARVPAWVDAQRKAMSEAYGQLRGLRAGLMPYAVSLYGPPAGRKAAALDLCAQTQAEYDAFLDRPAVRNFLSRR